MKENQQTERSGNVNQEAVFHINTENYVYPVSRNQLVIKLRAAKRDIKKCEIVYWNRTDEDKKKTEQLHVVHRDKLFDYYQIKLVFPKVTRYQKYYFCLEDYQERKWFYSTTGISMVTPEKHFFEYLYTNNNDVIQTPNWMKGIIYYQVFPERFCNGDRSNDPENCSSWGELPTRENYMGGDLEGIIQKIPYLKKLGIECIYLNPIFQGDFNHKYATTDYYEIDPIFGTKEKFKALVLECHKHEIKVILDGVFNHTGIHFAPFRDVVEKGNMSEYKDWFFINHYPITITHHDYECVGAYKYMPKLNTANQAVQKFVIEIMDYWIKEYKIDGWRLDVADEVDSSLWQEARNYLKDRYPNIALIGETWGYGGKLLLGNQMDSVMNYMFRDAVLDYYASEQIDVREFDSRINRMLGLYKEETNQVMYNLLDSHDTERFLFSCHEDDRKLKIAVAFQILFEGSPAIYYGDECGITGDNDPGCRRCMLWDDTVKQDIFEWYQKIIAIRKKYKSIRRGSFQSIVADDNNDIYGFVRTYKQERIYVLIHRGDTIQEIECPVMEKGKKYRELIEDVDYSSKDIREKSSFHNGDIMEYKSVIQIKMEPYSVKVISLLKEEKENENEIEKK